jgi:hypothetical protein
MKRLLILFLATVPLAGFSQTPSTNPMLKGIVDVEGLKLAIIEQPPPRPLELLFHEGQREGALEVVSINSTNRSVAARVSTNAQPHVLAIGNADATTTHGPGMTLQEVNLQTVLTLLAEFSDRTVLQHPLLAAMRFSFASPVTNRNEAAQVLKNALMEKRIAVVPDGSKFLLVAPAEMISALNPHSAGIATTNAHAGKAELLPRGSINFSGAQLGNVLMIYAELLGGKLDRTSLPPRDGAVFVKMQTAWTKEECLYAFETLVGWQGIKLVPGGNGLVKAVSTSTPEK